MVMELLKNSSILGLLGLLVSLATVGLAAAYAMRPNERTLALMRPLSLAAIFGGLSSFVVGIATILMGISATGAFTVAAWRLIVSGVAETFITLLVAFGCLTIAWLLVTLGLWRTSASL